MNILEISGLKKSFGSKEVIKDLSFSIPENTIFGFVGQNGAGKTTTMKMILGLMKSDAGTIKVNGQDVKFGNTATNKFIGYLPDVPEFYTYMTTREYLRFCGEIAGVPAGELKERIEELLTLVGLANEKRRIKGFSRGMKQRLGIAQALIHKPKLLICDEPTSALDPIGRKEVLDVLMAAKKDTTVIFSTHILSDVERICDEIVFIHDGRVALNGTIEKIKSQYVSSDYKITLINPIEIGKLLKFNSHLEKIDEYNVLVKCDKEFSINQVMDYVSSEKIEFLSINRCDKSLENMFLEVVK